MNLHTSSLVSTKYFLASCIDVSVKDCGLTSIQVSDNGKGIEEQNFELLTASHATSKISEFSGESRKYHTLLLHKWLTVCHGFAIQQ